MKILQPHTFNATHARQEWEDYKNFLHAKVELDEQKDILPFFAQRHDLSLLISRYFSKTATANCFAHEFDIFGSFRADLIIGDRKKHRYVLVEFENGASNSVFKIKGKKATPDWSTRLESAYSQLTDWLWKLENMRNTPDFLHLFGSHRASFYGLIVIGKAMNLTAQEQDRLEWRSQKTMIDSTAFEIISFDQLQTDFDIWLTEYFNVPSA
jgi:hypothetical protein